jgi:hypothetical protein
MGKPIAKLSLLAVLALLLALALAGTVRAIASGSAGARPADTSAQPTMKVIVLVKANGNSAVVVTTLKDQGARHVYKYHLIKAVAATISRDTWKNLRKDKNVARIVLDRQLSFPAQEVAGVTQATESASEASATLVAGLFEAPLGATEGAVVEPVLEPEGLQLTHAEDAWKITVNGKPVMGQGIRIGMLDSGTDPSHPDLAGAIEAYRDFGGSGLRDEFAHGTGTSSTIVAQGLPVFNRETKTYMKVSGMAPKAKVLMAKVWGADNIGFDSVYLRGLEWLVDQKVDIINCGGSGPSLPISGKDLISVAVQAAIDKGITCVALALNEGPGQGVMATPASLKDVVTVGAVHANRAFAQVGFLTSGSAYRSGQVADFSSRGPNALGDFKPDILGVGDDQWALAPIYETFKGTYSRGSTAGLQWFGGTSQASPTVAGNLALAMSAWKMAYPNQPLPSPAYWKNLLASTATDLGFPALENSTGLVNGEAAVRAVLNRGPSFLVSVADDPKNASSWSVKTDGGETVSTKIRIENTGVGTQHVTLQPTMFVADPEPIEQEITLTAATSFAYSEEFDVPDGTDFIEARCTWSSSPFVALRAVLYDSAGNLVSRNTMDAGYGHLALAQASLTGPSSQRPVVDQRPWTMKIVPFVYPWPPRYAFWPMADQPARFRIEFKHKVNWSAVTVTPSAVNVAPDHCAYATATLSAPTAAGTCTGGIVVSGTGVATTIPVSVRVPVDIAGGGVFSGEFTGSSKQILGGDIRSYDFDVPPATSSIQASWSLESERPGNLVDLFLIDPSGRPVNGKGGDVAWIDWGTFLSPPSAFTHTDEQLIWDDPEPGRWQLMVWAGGYSGEAFAEPFSGAIVLDCEAVSPEAWSVTAVPGTPVSQEFMITNTGPTTLVAYAESQLVADGERRYAEVMTGAMRGKLTPTMKGCMDWLFFPVPQRVRSARVDVLSTGTGSMVDLALWDPVFTPKAVSPAVSPTSNSISIADPMSGYWSVILTMASATSPAAPVGYRALFSCDMPVPIPGLESSATSELPVSVAANASGTLTATVTVPEGVPAGTLTGRLDFYTVVDMLTCVGGDRLGSVPVTITVE